MTSLHIHGSDFNLSGGCSGTIIQKFTRFFQIRVDMLKFGQISAKFQRACFNSRHVPEYNAGSNKNKNVMLHKANP